MFSAVLSTGEFLLIPQSLVEYVREQPRTVFQRSANLLSDPHSRRAVDRSEGGSGPECLRSVWLWYTKTRALGSGLFAKDLCPRLTRSVHGMRGSNGLLSAHSQSAAHA